MEASARIRVDEFKRRMGTLDTMISGAEARRTQVEFDEVARVRHLRR